MLSPPPKWDFKLPCAHTVNHLHLQPSLTLRPRLCRSNLAAQRAWRCQGCQEHWGCSLRHPGDGSGHHSHQAGHRLKAGADKAAPA